MLLLGIDLRNRRLGQYDSPLNRLESKPSPDTIDGAIYSFQLFSFGKIAKHIQLHRSHRS